MRLIIGRHGKAMHNGAYEDYHGGRRDAAPVGPDADVPLLEVGVRQAKAAGEFLRARGLMPDAVFLSPVRRTWQTWDQYGWPQLTACLDARLCEQDGGAFDRLPWRETQTERDAYALLARSTLDARPPEGESIREHLLRVGSWLCDVEDRAERRQGCPATVLVIAHHGTVGLLGMLCEDVDVATYLAARPEHLMPGYGSLLGYRYQGGVWTREFVFRNPVRERV